jgi:Putative amidoligase enzyme
MPLTFGTEFECFIPQGTTQAMLAAAINARLIAPATCAVEGYNHNARPHWKIVTDGSLGDYSRGVEIVSPILEGEEGIAQMRLVCEALTDFGCTVNQSAGFHVHVGARGEGLGFFKKLVRLYQTYERVIDGMMPVSRRASSNTYCRSLAGAAPSAISTANSVGELARVLTRASRAQADRYHKVNITAYSRHSTVEFRQHSGTVDATKAENWVRLCLKMVEAAKRADVIFETATGAAPRNTARYGSKRHTIIEMIMRENGATRTEIVAATDWPSVSISQIAASSGLNILTTRTGRETRYSLNAVATTPTRHDISVDGFCTLIGATDAERAYVQRRTANLGGPVAWTA